MVCEVNIIVHMEDSFENVTQNPIGIFQNITKITIPNSNVKIKPIVMVSIRQMGINERGCVA